MTESPHDPRLPDQTDPDWFREPTPREHRIAAGLFLAFGAFFITLFFFQSSWWFRWVILAIGLLSTIRGLRHLIGALPPTRGQ